MKLVLRTQGVVKVSDNVKEHINLQMESLDKLFTGKENVTLNVLCIEKNHHYKTELTISLKQIVLRSECNGDTLYASIDQAFDKIEQQLIKYKRKLNDLIKKREGVSEYFVNQTLPEPSPINEQLVRIKKVDLSEISVDEAITQMELVDHDFFMFKNEETHDVAVVYKRATGGYGLLEVNK